VYSEDLQLNYIGSNQVIYSSHTFVLHIQLLNIINLNYIILRISKNNKHHDGDQISKDPAEDGQDNVGEIG